MKKRERQGLVNKISTEIDIFKKNLAVLEESANLPSPESSVGRASLGDMIRDKSAKERELRAARLRLNKLESALRNIDDPDFGICYICEKQIPIAILIETPEITRCIRCKDK